MQNRHDLIHIKVIVLRGTQAPHGDTNSGEKSTLLSSLLIGQKNKQGSIEYYVMTDQLGQQTAVHADMR